MRPGKHGISPASQALPGHRPCVTRRTNAAADVEDSLVAPAQANFLLTVDLEDVVRVRWVPVKGRPEQLALYEEWPAADFRSLGRTADDFVVIVDDCVQLGTQHWPRVFSRGEVLLDWLPLDGKWFQHAPVLRIV